MWLRQMKTEHARYLHALLFTLSDSAVICVEDKNTSDSWPWQFHGVTLTVPLLFLISDCSLLPSLTHPVNKHSQIVVRLTYWGCWNGNVFFIFVTSVKSVEQTSCLWRWAVRKRYSHGSVVFLLPRLMAELCTDEEVGQVSLTSRWFWMPEDW